MSGDLLEYTRHAHAHDPGLAKAESELRHHNPMGVGAAGQWCSSNRVLLQANHMGRFQVCIGETSLNMLRGDVWLPLS